MSSSVALFLFGSLFCVSPRHGLTFYFYCLIGKSSVERYGRCGNFCDGYDTITDNFNWCHHLSHAQTHKTHTVGLKPLKYLLVDF